MLARDSQAAMLFALLVASVWGVPSVALAELTLTAEAYDTPGLPGYWTYDLTATIDDGYLNTFGFYGDVDGRSKGIHGPLHQKDYLAGGGVYSDLPDDSGFLVNRSAGLDLFPFETNESLVGVFSYTGIGGERQSHRSWKFARVVTNAPREVNLLGELVAERRYDDGSGGELFEIPLDTRLSDVMLGPAPTLLNFPSPPAPAPPGDVPPGDVPPIVNPPIAPEPPVYQPPNPGSSGLSLTANVYETPGRPGYQTYDITATIEDGYLNTFGFYGNDSHGRAKGIRGPLLNKDFGAGGGIFTEASDDTGFLVDREAGLELFMSESDTGVEGVFSYTGVGGQRQSHRSWTFARVVTDAADEVELLGELVAERRYSDGTGGELFELGIDTLLSDIAIGPAPTLGDFPQAPKPLPPPLLPIPVPVERPPLLQPPLVQDPPSSTPPVQRGITRQQYIDHLNLHVASIPGRMEGIQQQLASLVTLREAASDPDFDPSAQGHVYPLFRDRPMLGGVLVTVDENGQIVRTSIEPQWPSAEEVLQRIEWQEVNLQTSLEALETQLDEVEAGLLAAQEADFQPDGLPLFPYIFVSHYPMPGSAIIDAIDYRLPSISVVDSISFIDSPTAVDFDGGISAPVIRLDLDRYSQAQFAAGTAAEVPEPGALWLFAAVAMKLATGRRPT